VAVLTETFKKLSLHICNRIHLPLLKDTECLLCRVRLTRRAPTADVKRMILTFNAAEYQAPITVVTRPKAWTVFARSNTGIVGSNPTSGTDVWVRLFCVRAVLCGGSGLATSWSPNQGVLSTLYRIKKV
jgi:hypothetical protein